VLAEEGSKTLNKLKVERRFAAAKRTNDFSSETIEDEVGLLRQDAAREKEEACS
jgi:hypothetical protein